MFALENTPNRGWMEWTEWERGSNKRTLMQGLIAASQSSILLHTHTHTHSSRLPAVHLILSHPPFSLSSLSRSLSLSCHVCRSVNRSSGFVHLFLCEQERGSGLHSSKGFSYSLYSHPVHPVHPDRVLSPSQTHRLLRLLSGRAGRRGGILPRILPWFATACTRRARLHPKVERSAAAGDEGGMDRRESRTWNWGLALCVCIVGGCFGHRGRTFKSSADASGWISHAVGEGCDSGMCVYQLKLLHLECWIAIELIMHFVCACIRASLFMSFCAIRLCGTSDAWCFQLTDQHLVACPRRQSGMIEALAGL